MTNAWHDMTALELGAGIASGDIDPVSLAEHFLARIEAEDTDHTVYIRATPERAIAEATAARARAQSGLRRGPLDGVPMSWKDLVAMAGEPTTGGSPLFAQQPPATHDALQLSRAMRAGMVCLGRTNLPEFAFSAMGINPHYGTPANPFDPETPRVPGGSSSGAAVSVSRGLAPAGIGSDTGGSVRIPAAWNDLVGLKTTAGVLPNDGVLPLVRDLDSVGPLTRDVADAAAIFAVLAADEPIDLEGASVEGAQFLLPDMLWSDVDDDIAAVMDDAIARLEAAGAYFTRKAVPELDEITEKFLSFGDLFSATAYAELREKVDAQPDLVYEQILRRLHLAVGASAVDVLQGWLEIDKCAERYYPRVAPYTAVLCPTSTMSPPIIADVQTDAEAYAEAQRRIPVNTRTGNLLRLCAVTVPAGLANGLPAGLMVYGLPNRDRYILRVAKGVEQALSNGHRSA